ncbi:hypothetical protein Tco_0373548 [Tanacetum coccineum]
MAEQQIIKYAPQWTNKTMDNSTAIAFDLYPSTDEPEKRPLTEFLIRFSVLNGKRPLTFDFSTFCSSTGLNYDNGKYVDHPTPEVLGGNYSSTEQVNSIQQLLAYSLITGTEGPEASGALSKKRKKPKSKKPPTKTKIKAVTHDENKGETSSEVEPNTEPLQLQTFADIQAILLSDDELDKESDEEEVLAAGDDMDEDLYDDEEVRTPSPKQDQPDPSHV